MRLLAPHQPVDQLGGRLRVRQPGEVRELAADGVERVRLRQQLQIAVRLVIEDVASVRQRLERVSEPLRRLASPLGHQPHHAEIAHEHDGDTARVAERIGAEDDALAAQQRHGSRPPQAAGGSGALPGTARPGSKSGAARSPSAGCTTPPDTITCSPNSTGQSK